MREPTEMELRVARTIFAKMFPECPDDFWRDERLMACYLDTARAAIRAMREPTMEMLDGAMARTNEHPQYARDVYQSLIDAASPEDD